MPNFNKVLRSLREEQDITRKELARRTGVSQSSINMYERGDREPSIETLEAFADYFNVNMDYLLGKSDKRNPDIYDAAITKQSTAKTRIPVIGTSAAGIPIDAVQQYIDDKDPDTWEEITDDLARTGTFVAVRITGNSMEPRIFDGDIVIVRIQETADNGDTVIVFVNGDEATCKKIKKTPEGVMLMSNNPTYDPMFFTYKEVEQLPVRIYGKVVEVRGRL